MFQRIPSSIGHKRVFDSVFPPSLLSGISSAPDATPILGFTPPGVPSGSIQTSSNLEDAPAVSEEPEPEQVTWDRSWHIATAFLAIPDKRFKISNDGNCDDHIGDRVLLKRWARDPPSTKTRDSLYYVGADASQGRELRRDTKECDLKTWYISETRRHFLKNFKGSLIQILEGTEKKHVLTRLTRRQGIPVLRLSVRAYYAVTMFSLPHSFSDILATELTAACSIILGTKNNAERLNAADTDGDEMDVDPRSRMCYSSWRTQSPDYRISSISEREIPGAVDARLGLTRLIEGLQEVGLGGQKCQVVFANVMNNMITEFVISSYSGLWDAPSFAIEHLRLWIGKIFGRLVLQVLQCLRQGEHGVPRGEEGIDITLTDIHKWQEIAVTRLAALRISELFDIVVEWDASSGAIEDLKSYTTNPMTRLYLSSMFNTAIFQRLLHPGASTVEILQLYISIIRALTQLDPRGVLLDRVARPIRRYLRERDDTVKVIVNGLLADVSEAKDQENTDPNTLMELAIELTSARQASLRNDSGELDWDDMNWVPDPVDAVVDYKRSKQSDVIGSMITLFDSKEVFVKELQDTLCGRLLSKSGTFDQEVSVLELLKVRFGESALQACEVMLRDSLDSKRIDTVIRTDKGLDQGPTTDIHAKILSRLYWPELQEQEFKIPAEITSLQEKYSAGFESLKPSRN
ncbi:anaphase-promoting complex subunit 2 [Nannizzia gypsea CBS 118893]|uniref:Anaphase-promoting complex subunit 2 n=1 Tax=Arthroderma gypseum (strain ATCC MYA-4604 / CBS 118893) TaxID=535722 RepID=E4UPF7_ARTGP|nr:anaphase-promoting complex subunit 2 [Nannizzia gypsea CBS 118893]EFQ99046.1 anaphase-promoting complex subunit 2 [Nannizzia gypsea CBS 118893]